MLIEFNKLLSLSMKLYRENFKTFLKYMLLAVIPYVILIAGALAVGATALLSGADFVSFSAVTAGGILVLLVCIVIMAVLTVWFNTAFARTINSLYNGRPAGTVGERLRESKSLILRSIGASLATGLYAVWPLIVCMILLGVSTLLLGAGGGQLIKIIYFIGVIMGIFGLFYAVYKSIQLIFTINFVMIDQTSIKEGLQKSTMITAGRWWGIFSRFFVSGLVIWLGLVVISFVLSIISRMIPVFGMVEFLINIALQFLVSPLILSITVILFNEAKKTPVSTSPATPPTPMSPPTPPIK